MKMMSIPYRPKALSDYADLITQYHGFTLTGGRYTIIGWDPIDILTGKEDAFERMQERIASSTSSISPCKGWYGYVGYEMAERFHRHLPTRQRDLHLPDMCMGWYENVVVFDHEKKSAYSTNPSLRAPRGGSHPGWIASSREALLAMTDLSDSYHASFQKIQSALRRGDCYQVNLAQRFTGDFEGHPWDYFLHLMQHNPAPFAAYFHLPEGAIISCSPERFLRIDQDRILTQPIKGTCARLDDPIADKMAAENLRQCEKNQAENLMIVDLMRNDLGQVCVPGTVEVPSLFALESYRSVHHLVSTVTGQLKPEVSAIEAFLACFPGGSITGAPKLAAMQLIHELEPQARHIYCGSIGYWDASGVLDMNIAIRTAVVSQGKCHLWAGSGIVLDSVCEQEYQECFDKIRPFLI